MSSAVFKPESAAAAIVADIRAGAEAISLNAARAWLAPDGRRPDLSVVYRLATRGKVRADGTRVVLEVATFPVGGKITTKPAIDRFFSRLNGLEPATPLAADFGRAHRQAEAMLAASGI